MIGRFAARAAGRLATAARWAAAVAVFAAMAACLAVVPFFAPPRAWDRLAKALARRLVACFGYRVRVEGLERLAAAGPCVIVCNHVNSLDGFLLYGYLPVFFRVLDQAQHFSWPVWGWFSRRFGNISLDQGGGGRTAGGLRAAGRALAAGTSILVFPEGHRSRDGEFREFRPGAFRLAQRLGVPVVPVVQAGTWEVMHKGSGGVAPGPVELVVLPALAPDPAASSTAGAAAERCAAVRAAMAAAYAAARSRLAAAPSLA
jgi:1-acyl-sn-glycerol-3-phosphate acyltransferase